MAKARYLILSQIAVCGTVVLFAGAGGLALAGLDVPPPAAPDLRGFVTTDTLSAAMGSASPTTVTKVDAVPTTGPGPGKCRFTVVPSNLVQSGGITGTPGTCSRIVQCGTSGVYVVTQFNVGDGC